MTLWIVIGLIYLAISGLITWAATQFFDGLDEGDE